MTHLFWLITGARDPSGPVNSLWGGFISAAPGFAVIGAIGALYRKHNCHEVRCWRLGHHPVDGTPYIACRKHHPELPGKQLPGEIARAWTALHDQRRP